MRCNDANATIDCAKPIGLTRDAVGMGDQPGNDGARIDAVGIHSVLLAVLSEKLRHVWMNIPPNLPRYCLSTLTYASEQLAQILRTVGRADCALRDEPLLADALTRELALAEVTTHLLD